MKKDEYECAEIISDSEDDEVIVINKKTKIDNENKKTKIKKPRIPATILKKCYNEDINVFEIGVDEVGRGPLFGRVYTAAVILPKDDSFDCSMVKDSKKFTSKKKILEASQYIKDALTQHTTEYLFKDKDF
jgi:ribonuclease HII